MYPYKIQVHQQLDESSISIRYSFASDMFELIDTKQIDPRNIIFSYEAHICLYGYINDQNFRIWGTETLN